MCIHVYPYSFNNEYNNDKVPISDRPFPCDSDFDEDLKSDIADVLQVGNTWRTI